MPTYYPINEEAARRAKEMNSHFDYKPGSATESYRRSVDEAAAVAEAQKARVSSMYHEKIDRLLDTYARKLAENLNHGYAIAARCPSVLIAGPANFPARKKEKQNQADEANMKRWQRIQGILDKIRSTGMGGISSDDSDVLPKLYEKLAGLEQIHAAMKAVNAYYRKHGTLDGCADMPSDIIEDLKTSMARDRRPNPKPFESYILSNSSASIRDVKVRIANLEALRDTQSLDGWTFLGGEVVMNQEENRVQILFDEKPDEDIRTDMKRAGFHWSPSQRAWQRMLNRNSINAAKQLTEKWIMPPEKEGIVKEYPFAKELSSGDGPAPSSYPQQSM